MRRKFSRYGAMLAGMVVLFQASGCAIDATSMSTVITPLITQMVAGVLSGTYCPPV